MVEETDKRQGGEKPKQRRKCLTIQNLVFITDVQSFIWLSVRNIYQTVFCSAGNCPHTHSRFQTKLKKEKGCSFNQNVNDASL